MMDVMPLMMSCLKIRSVFRELWLRIYYPCASVGVFDPDLDYVSISLLFSVLALDLFVTQTSCVYMYMYMYMYDFGAKNDRKGILKL
jgi:hypothetical protein